MHHFHHFHTRRWSGLPRVMLLAAPFLLLVGDGLRAETLAQALDAARHGHPRIEGARSRARAAREGVAQAKAGFMPTIAAHGSFGGATDPASRGGASSAATRSIGYDVLVTQPLYDGGRTSSAVGVARASATAEASVAQSVEQQTILAGITAYLDVRATRRLTTIHARNVALLERLVSAAKAQLSVRESTRADVAQAAAALAAARAELEAARGSEASAVAAFEEALLHAPGKLDPPPPLAHFLPLSRAQAIALSETANTDLAIARARLDAARHAVDQARASFMPTVSLQAGYERPSAPLMDHDGRGGAVARVVATVPIYTGGLAQAQERAALHGHAAAAYQVADTMAQVRTAVARSWSQMTAARAAVGSVRKQQAASRAALDGLLAERNLGQRSMTEVIVAQQAALAADTAYDQTTRSAYVSLCSVLLLVARLDAAAVASASRTRADSASTAAVERSQWSTTIDRPAQPAVTQPAVTQPAVTQPAVAQPAVGQPARNRPTSAWDTRARETSP